MRNFQQQFGLPSGSGVYGDNVMPNLPMQTQETQTVSPTFLTGFNE